MEKIKVVIVGAGARGKDVYSKYIFNNPDIAKIVAVADPNEERRKILVNQHNIVDENIFDNWRDLENRERIGDAIIIANNDEDHYLPCKLALEKGYHVLLEKPMSNNLEECIKLGELARQYPNQILMIAHVLRYTPFFETIKKIIDSGELGELVSIQHNENIGYWHYAHSFTRGNWKNSNETSPLILSKSCHDMDILSWLTSSKCKKIAAFGSLSSLCSKHYDKNTMSERCLDCSVEESCPYSAVKLYLGEDPIMVNYLDPNPTRENVLKALRNGDYGKCVYKCDNNVVDHMTTILEFENGVTSTFNLSAFTLDCNRTIKLMFTKGEVGGNDEKNTIEIKRFGEKEITTIYPTKVEGGHNGGDTKLTEAFLNSIRNKDLDIKTSAAISVQSHVMAFAAEYSRVNNVVVNIDDFIRESMEMERD